MRNSVRTIALGFLLFALGVVLFLEACKISHKAGKSDMNRQAQEIKKKIPDFEVTLLDQGIKLALNTDVLFEFDKFELQGRIRKDLDDLAAIFQRYPDTHIEIRRYTDNTGSDSHNMVLSENRAKATEKYLENKGIAPGRMTAKGYGASTPKYPNDTEANRTLNRRVWVHIFKEPSPEDIQNGPNCPILRAFRPILP